MAANNAKLITDLYTANNARINDNHGRAIDYECYRKYSFKSLTVKKWNNITQEGSTWDCR
ncbi:MAG: hypothetical protein IPO06_09120 [Leptospiraceae bacterium]|nr:hypothetical protein [Leptospiraceae bacterium]